MQKLIHAGGESKTNRHKTTSNLKMFKACTCVFQKAPQGTNISVNFIRSPSRVVFLQLRLLGDWAICFPFYRPQNIKVQEATFPGDAQKLMLLEGRSGSHVSSGLCIRQKMETTIYLNGGYEESKPSPLSWTTASEVQ